MYDSMITPADISCVCQLAFSQWDIILGTYTDIFPLSYAVHTDVWNSVDLLL